MSIVSGEVMDSRGMGGNENVDEEDILFSVSLYTIKNNNNQIIISNQKFMVHASMMNVCGPVNKIVIVIAGGGLVRFRLAGVAGAIIQR